MAERILGYDSRFITISLPHMPPRSINLSVERRYGGQQAGGWGAGVHIDGVPSGQIIHQYGIFDFYNERHVRGSSDVYSI